MTRELTDHITRIWDADLAKMAEGLNLADSESHRETFTTRVMGRCFYEKRDRLVALARHYGATIKGNAGHVAAYEALAAAYIARVTK